MRPAERLRQAARLARETAEAATPGPWVLTGPRETVVWSEAAKQGVCDTYAVALGADAAHIALWSPPAALAVAAWLEEALEWWFDTDDDFLGDEQMLTPALAVADALLQTQPVKP